MQDKERQEFIQKETKRELLLKFGETIGTLDCKTTVKPTDIYMPKWFCPHATMYRDIFKKNPYRGTLGHPVWDLTAMQIVSESQIGVHPDWSGIEGFSYGFQTKKMVDGMVKAGCLRIVANQKGDALGYALTDEAIEKLFLRSREIMGQLSKEEEK